MNGKSARLMLMVLVIISALVLAGGCGSDDVTSDSGDNGPTDTGTRPANTPQVPSPEYATEALPDESDFLLVQSIPVEDFSPYLSGESSLLDTLNTGPIFEYRIKPDYYDLITDNVEVYDPAIVLQYSDNDGVDWHDMNLQPDTSVFWLAKLGEYDGHYYYTSPYKAKWAVALMGARSYGGYLANITSQGENDAIKGWIGSGSTDNYWIGATDYSNEGQWVWSEGGSVSNGFWESGEPNNSGDEDFAVIKRSGQWNDENDQNFQFIVESETPLPEDMPGVILADRLYEFGGSYLPINGDFSIYTTPYMARGYVWKKVFQTTLEYPSTYSQEQSVTWGTSTTEAQEFGLSIGLRLEYSYGGFTAEMTTEFSARFSTETTISSDTTITKVYSIDSIEGETIAFSVWQLVERFMIVDENGNPWLDPIYSPGRAIVMDSGQTTEYQRVVRF